MQIHNDWTNWILKEYNWVSMSAIICDSNTEPTNELIRQVWDIKQQKKEAIDKIASLSDELNLLAHSLEVTIDIIAINNPEILVNPTIIKAKDVFSKIKVILSTEK